jgi:hypothetical protein
MPGSTRATLALGHLGVRFTLHTCVYDPLAERIGLQAADALGDEARRVLSRPWMQVDATNLLSLVYVAVFPSTLAYLCFNRGVQLIGANRAAPFFHLIPVFGSAMAIFFLGEQPHLFHLFGYAGADGDVRRLKEART